MFSWWSWLLMFLGGLGAGLINSIAGGGSLITFPLLVFLGVPAINANATNSLALVPGSFSAFWAYRNEIKRSSIAVWIMVGCSIVGGVLGSVLVLATGNERFTKLVPWLLLIASMLFVLQDRMAARKAQKSPVPSHDLQPAVVSPSRYVLLAMVQTVIATYGGYFGAGMGILMLTALGIVGVPNIHERNAIKNIAAVAINSLAAITFILRGKVEWIVAVVVAIGAVLGGYLGAHYAKNTKPATVRKMIVSIGVTIAIVMFIRQWMALR